MNLRLRQRQRRFAGPALHVHRDPELPDAVRLAARRAPDVGRLEVLLQDPRAPAAAPVAT